MSNKVLGDKDVNAAVSDQSTAPEKDVKSLEYHRQALQSKMADEKSSCKYVSPSDNIMSPCSAKISALRNKHASKAKPRSLFAQASAKKLSSESAKKSEGESSLDARPVKAKDTDRPS